MGGQIKQREDKMRLGREKKLAKETGYVWWKDSVGGTLACLHARKRNEKGKKKEKDSKRSKTLKWKEESAGAHKTYTDEELFEATRVQGGSG